MTNLVTSYNHSTKGNLADMAAKQVVNQLKQSGESFEFSAGFSYSKIKSDKNYKYSFFQEVPNYQLLGLSNSIKKQVKSKIKNIDNVKLLLNYCSVENSHVYKPVPVISAWEYDLNHAYTTLLHKLFIDEKTYNKMLDYKYNKRFNINQSIGVALLGEKIITKYRHGKPFDKEIVFNPLRGIFYMLRFLIIDSIKKMLNDYFYKERIAYFVDALIIQSKENLADMQHYFTKSFVKSIISLRDKLKKYDNIELFDMCDFESLDNSAFEFKIDYIRNMLYEKSEFNGKNILTFSRKNQILTYK